MKRELAHQIAFGALKLAYEAYINWQKTYPDGDPDVQTFLDWARDELEEAKQKKRLGQ